MISRAIPVLAMGVAIFAASPAYCGDPITIYEDGTGNRTGIPVTSTPIAGGGVDFFDPDLGGGKLGDYLVYEPDGHTPGDLVRFVPHTSSSCTDCADVKFYVLSGGRLEADVTSLPSYGTLLGTATEQTGGTDDKMMPSNIFDFDNGFGVTGYATHSAISDSYVTYRIDPGTGPGALASGSFTFDLTSNTISTWDISVRSGSVTTLFENGGTQSSSYGKRATAWDAEFSLGDGSKSFLDLYFVSPFTGQTTLALLSKSIEKIGGVGAQIDNPSVSAVPEPGTLALLAAGLGFIGFTTRRYSNR